VNSAVISLRIDILLWVAWLDKLQFNIMNLSDIEIFYVYQWRKELHKQF